MTDPGPFSRGSVWQAELGGKSRPVVVATHPALCRVLARLTVVRVTTRPRGVETEVELGEANGLAEGSVVNCLDLATLSTDALSGHRGDLDPAQVRRLDDALRLSLGLES